jgi:4-hydroxybenzoate polyprenyltransferase
VSGAAAPGTDRVAGSSHPNSLALVRELVLASRPLSWINTGLPFLAAAYDVQRGVTPEILVGFLYFLVPFNLLMYGVNDIFDYESDLANPRKHSLEGGLVPPGRRRLTWLAIGVTNLPFIVAIAILAPPAGTLAVLLAAFAAIAYSAPPLRTKVRPFADSLTSASHFVLPAVAGFLIAGSAVAGLPWVALAGFMAWGVASHALGAIQDISYDRAAGIGSIATSIGARATAWLSLAGYGIAVVAAASYGGVGIVGAAALASYLLLPSAVLAQPSEAQARRAWRSFLGLNLLVGFVLTQVLLRHWGIVSADLGEYAVAGAVTGAGICLAQLLASGWVLRRSRSRALAVAGDAPLPRLSVVIPCRDEAARLPAILAALGAQDHPELEVIVVDDGSSDGSAEVARQGLALLRAGSSSRDAVIAAPAKPAGWAGKSWACDQGAARATGTHILFLDADTVPSPPALRTLHRIAVATGAGLVSGITTYGMPSARERAFTPGFPMTIFGLLPLWASAWAGGRNRRLAFAYGPLMLVGADAYRTAGGHAATPGSEREDLDLARTMASTGAPTVLIHAADLATTRHYPDGDGALRAWRRVALSYGGDSFATVLATMAVATVAWLLPLALPVLGVAAGDPRLIEGGAVALALLAVFRVGLSVLENEPLRAVAWHPVTVGATIGAQAVSLADGVLGRTPIWRGRSFEPRTR